MPALLLTQVVPPSALVKRPPEISSSPPAYSGTGPAAPGPRAAVANAYTDPRRIPLLDAAQVRPLSVERNSAPPANLFWNTPDVVGKSTEDVCPATYTLPLLSTVIAFPASFLPPRRNCVYTAPEPAAFNFVINTSVPVDVDGD